MVLTVPPCVVVVVTVKVTTLAPVLDEFRVLEVEVAPRVVVPAAEEVRELLLEPVTELLVLGDEVELLLLVAEFDDEVLTLVIDATIVFLLL